MKTSSSLFRRTAAAAGAAALLLVPVAPASADAATPYRTDRECAPFHGNILCYEISGVLRYATTPAGITTIGGYTKYHNEVYFQGLLQYTTDSLRHFSNVVVEDGTQVEMSVERFTMDFGDGPCTTEIRLVLVDGVPRHSTQERDCAG